jgi:Ca2+-transporting ATPase
MAAKRALARRMRVVESLGTVNVICADKTGTLTENKMTVREIWFNRRLIRVTGRGYEKVGKFILDEKELDPQELFPILRAGMLCNNSQAGEKFQGDPTEIALLISASKAGLEKEELEEKYKRVRELVFTPARKMMTTVHKIKRKEISFTKGAPEVVLKKCDRIYLDGKIKKVSSKLRHEILAANEQLAGKALRVLGFAYNEGFRKRPEQRMIFLGLQAMADPPRREVAGAIKECQQAGIRIIMITGDNKVTAQAIAKEIGLGTRTLEGKDLDRISDARLSVLAEKVDIFARVTPAHKLRILKALREKKHIIAMTGDGVNDAPALKAAEVGIAMGIRGTDVAKETADMILLDDNFATIRDAVREGRRIFDNLRKFVNYLLPTNLAEVFVIFLASLFGYMPLTVVQILWVNLLTDGFPALALGADPAAPGIMSRPPRPKGEGVINRRLAFLIAAIGTKKTAILLAIFFASLPLGLAVAQTTVFTGFVLYELVRIGVIRQQERLSFFSNKWLLLAIGCSLAAQLAVIYTPLSHFFGTVPLGLFSWALLLLGVVIGWIAAIGITRAVIRWTG